MKKTLINFAAAMLCSLAAIHASADTFSTRTGCPDGFFPAANGICVAGDFTSKPSVDLDSRYGCPDGFEQPPGVRFCIAENAALDIKDDTLLVKKIARECPDGFSRAPYSSICIADNLVLDTKDGVVELKQPTAPCPEGFHIPVGGHICVASNLKADMLPEPNGEPCKPGFVRPPGVTVCIATHIVYDKGRIDNSPIAPRGSCPTNWYKPEGVNFCIPKYTVNASQFVSRLGKHVQLNIDPVYEGYGVTPCPEGTEEVWWDMPIYDEQGLFVIDHVPARVCVPEDLEPAG